MSATGRSNEVSRWAVLSRHDDRYDLCRCVCGVERLVRRDHRIGGASKSCGCLSIDVTRARSIKHGYGRRGASRASEYQAWAGMIQRCHNTQTTLYCYYGARGIKVCPQWRSDFVAFLAHIGPRPGRGFSVERKNNLLGYEPGNVRWATQSEQMRNTRRTRFFTIGEERLCLKAWCERLDLNYKAVWQRIARGMSFTDALIASARSKT